ncbi:MAG: hypothetical protein LBL48_05555 [Azoarcus sp.]|nr:hypothetical protein [Azoarcus sp.]
MAMKSAVSFVLYILFLCMLRWLPFLDDVCVQVLCFHPTIAEGFIVATTSIGAILGLWGNLVEKCEEAVDSGIYAVAVAADIGTDAFCGIFNPGGIFSSENLEVGGKLGTVLGLWGNLVETCEEAVDSGIYALAGIADIGTDMFCGIFNPGAVFSDLM